MKTKAQEIAAEEPYTLIKAPGYTPPIYYWIKRPNGTQIGPFEHEHASKMRKELNVAYATGQQDRWIPLSERVPDEGQRILATDVHGFVRLTVLQRRHMRSNGSSNGELMWNIGSSPQVFQLMTHWMPLPPSPTS